MRVKTNILLTNCQTYLPHTLDGVVPGKPFHISPVDVKGVVLHMPVDPPMPDPLEVSLEHVSWQRHVATTLYVMVFSNGLWAPLTILPSSFTKSKNAQ